jgi:hypothetical protein
MTCARPPAIGQVGAADVVADRPGALPELSAGDECLCEQPQALSASTNVTNKIFSVLFAGTRCIAVSLNKMIFTRATAPSGNPSRAMRLRPWH